ncbi:hypothetical protein EY643_10860 [Halioglobus maricola]|uniref:Uncharacterized protein n=2 Tax=Halioglobus maricola TaxID=2601894 RepID=A0A5P9NJV1_9GAMM|nr:hypothetical protein EY643_10860 [Halioglobus maricola]
MESDLVKYNRVIQAMSGAGAIYIGSAASNTRMVVTHGLLGESPLKPLLETYLQENTPLAGLMSRADGSFTVFWNGDASVEKLNEALGPDTEHLVWDSASGAFGQTADLWPADYVFGQFLLLVSLGQIRLPMQSGKVFCPFCGEQHEPQGEITPCPRLNDEFAQFTAGG